MPLAGLSPGIKDWQDVKHAAFMLLKSSQLPNVDDLQHDLRNNYPTSTAIDIHTGVNNSRKAVLVTHDDTIVIAFQGSESDEIMKNYWTHGKGPNWYDIPYPVHVNGDQVHSFYLDMWNGMKDAFFAALTSNISKMQGDGITPGKLTVAGYSMGGGVSTLAFTDIINYITSHYGSSSPSPQYWASNDNLRSFIQHTTFASTGAADIPYLTKLNHLYERYGIRAWDFMNHWDHTQHLTPPFFRGWRGHRYILPHAVSHRFDASFGAQGHRMEGYFHCAEWMAEFGTDQVKSAYHY